MNNILLGLLSFRGSVIFASLPDTVGSAVNLLDTLPEGSLNDDDGDPDVNSVEGADSDGD